jgi:hypothetical protein
MSTSADLTPFRRAEARYLAASARFCSLPQRLEFDDPDAFEREQDIFNEAVEAVDEAPVANWQEFGAQFIHACDDGHSVPNEAMRKKLLADAKRLAGEDRR